MLYDPLDETKNIYRYVMQAVSLEQLSKIQDVMAFDSPEVLQESSESERVTQGLWVLLQLMEGSLEESASIDESLIDFYLAQLYRQLNVELDLIMHDEGFQALESLWRSVEYVALRVKNKNQVKLELLDVSKDELRQDFERNKKITRTGLYHHLYTQEYDMPGGEPFSSVVSDMCFDASAKDMRLLSSISKVSAAAHCPFLANVSPQFFQQDSFEHLSDIEDLDAYLDTPDYLPWHRFREQEDARYVGLCLPKFLLRLPYEEFQSTDLPFSYREDVFQQGHQSYLWGKASFALAANLSRSFEQYGWLVNIRGPQSGGSVDDLPLHHYLTYRGSCFKIPIECLISETQELQYASSGFIPLSYYKNTDKACFFSANSVQKVFASRTGNAPDARRVNAQLPYVFLSARLAHCLKVLQREEIGLVSDLTLLESRFNHWMNQLITKMKHPTPALMSQYPLKEGLVCVHALEHDPGYFRVEIQASPHFQLEGVDVHLSLISKLPRKAHAQLKELVS